MVDEVLKFDPARAWGFVQAFPEEGKVQSSQFFHQSSVVDRVILQAGDFVQFQIRESVKKPGQTEAYNVRLLRRGDDSVTVPEGSEKVQP